MNVAIVIGIDKYKTLPNLPACAGDALAVKRLLEGTKKYDSVFVNGDRLSSSALRSWLREISSDFTDSELDELFFFFSGHGTIDANQFIYCCHDFEGDAPSQTSLRNEEIDTYFRELNPKIMVKVLDACHSGKRIIKDLALFAKSISNPGYQHFIQFASSMEDQYSFANGQISVFTEHFVRGACSVSEGATLYIDIENYLIDHFASVEQTPYFIA